MCLDHLTPLYVTKGVEDEEKLRNGQVRARVILDACLVKPEKRRLQHRLQDAAVGRGGCEVEVEVELI